jgi:anti-anti-sigma factor
VSDPHYEQRLIRSPTETPSRFSCRRSTIDGVAHVGLSGELDIANYTHLDAALRLAWASSDVVVVDLRELEFIDSSGTRLLVDADRRIRRAGGRLIVVRGPWEVDWLFVLLGIDRMLELVDSPPISLPATRRPGVGPGCESSSAASRVAGRGSPARERLTEESRVLCLRRTQCCSGAARPW